MGLFPRANKILLFKFESSRQVEFVFDVTFTNESYIETALIRIVVKKSNCLF